MTRVVRLVLLVLAAVVIAGVAWKTLRPAPVPIVAVRIAKPPAAPAAPSALVDPLLPGRAAPIDSARSALAADWVRALPRFQYSRHASERGGVEPCAASVPSAANAIIPLSRGSLFIPERQVLDAQGAFDLVFHLQGEGPIRRELVESGQPFVLYTFTLPVGASYAPLFAGSSLLAHLIDEITRVVAKRTDSTAHLGHLALSAWSAGFEGVRSILYQPEATRISALILIDGLHAPRGQGGLAKNLEPFVNFARRAEHGETWFAITHSSIQTIDYTSTTESAHFLINELGGQPVAVHRDDGFGLELVDFFASGKLNVRGYAGNDKADHCAQLFLLRSLFTALHQHFHP